MVSIKYGTLDVELSSWHPEVPYLGLLSEAYTCTLRTMLLEADISFWSITVII